MSDFELTDTGFNNLLGLDLVGMEDDYYVVELNIEAQHLNLANKVHGGIYMAMLDVAMARVLHNQSTSDSSSHVTVELKTNFLSGAKSGKLRAEGRIVKIGRRLGFAKAILFDDQSQQLAIAAATFMFF